MQWRCDALTAPPAIAFMCSQPMWRCGLRAKPWATRSWPSSCAAWGTQKNCVDNNKNCSDGFYALSPAFDVLPAAQGLGYQQMRVGVQGHEASIANAMSEAPAFGLTDAQARQIVQEIAKQTAQWHAIFKRLGVREKDLDFLAQYLDGSHLREQRQQPL